MPAAIMHTTSTNNQRRPAFLPKRLPVEGTDVNKSSPPGGLANRPRTRDLILSLAHVRLHDGAPAMALH